MTIQALTHAGQARDALEMAIASAPDGTAELVVSVRVRLGDAPMSPEATRLIALLERLAATPAEQAPPDDGTLRIDPAARAVVRDGREIPLTRREFDLLAFLARHPRRAFSRRELLDHVWDGEEVGGRTVDVHVRRLRLKIEEPLVSTLRGVGYRLHPSARVSIT